MTEKVGMSTNVTLEAQIAFLDSVLLQEWAIAISVVPILKEVRKSLLKLKKVEDGK